MGATPFRRQRGARFRPGRIPRRALLRAAAGAGLGAAAWTIAGCGDDEAEPLREPDHPPPPEAPAGALATPIAPPVPDTQPRPGGALRMHGTLEALDFFDIHRSQLVNTQAFSALQQNRLIRYADFDAGVLEGDLAGLPEIPAEDTYVFMLRADVRWWDRPPTNGRRFTAEDVRVNVERHVAALDAAGAADPLFRRRSTYAAGGVPEALDERTVLFRTHGPDATYLTHAHAGPWSFYQAPEIWTAYGDRLRDDPINPDYYSGTGPFIIDTLRPREGVTFRRNPDFFRSGLPHLDRFEYLHLPNAEGQERAYREGRVDVWNPGDPLALEPARVEFPDHILTQRPLPFGIVLTFLYHQRAAGNPFRDPRVARATHLALDRHDLIDATYRGFARLSGAAPWFTPGWALPESELLLQPGYRRDKTADRATARALLAAAGFSGPLPLVLPDVFVATYPGVDLRIRRDLESGLGIALANHARAPRRDRRPGAGGQPAGIDRLGPGDHRSRPHGRAPPRHALGRRGELRRLREPRGRRRTGSDADHAGRRGATAHLPLGRASRPARRPRLDRERGPRPAAHTPPALRPSAPVGVRLGLAPVPGGLDRLAGSRRSGQRGPVSAPPTPSRLPPPPAPAPPERCSGRSRWGSDPAPQPRSPRPRRAFASP